VYLSAYLSMLPARYHRDVFVNRCVFGWALIRLIIFLF
jgi:hypothetical protein